MGAVFVPPRPETAWAVLAEEPDDPNRVVVRLVAGWVVYQRRSAQLLTLMELFDETGGILGYGAMETWDDPDEVTYHQTREEAEREATRLRRELTATTG